MDLTANYSLNRIKKGSDKCAMEALDIYLRVTNPALRTDSNNIVYWIENYNKEFKDEFHALSFAINGDVVGYTQITYFQEEKLVVIDYLALDESKRKHNVFFEFIDQIRGYIEKSFPNFLFAITELAQLENPLGKSDNYELMGRLLGMVGFYEISIPYYQLELSKNNHESNLKANLFVNPRPANNEIKKETAESILNVLYFKHYVRWFRIYDKSSVEEYLKKANNLFNLSKKGIGNSVQFKKSIPESIIDSRNIPSVAVNQKNINTSFLVFLALIVIAFLTISIFSFTDMEIENIREIFLLIVIGFLMISSIFISESRKVLKTILGKSFNFLKNKS